MVATPKLWETDPIEYLVRLKFPNMLMMGRAVRKSTDLAAEFGNLRTRAEAYREQLLAMSEGDRQSLIADARQDETKRHDESRETQERNQFFNQPRADADVAYWASASYWTLDETAALSLGKEPRVVTWEAVSPHSDISPFAKAFEARRELVNRAEVMGQLLHKTPPSAVLAWAERMRISMPTEIVEAIRALGLQVADWKFLHDIKAAEVLKLETIIAAKEAVAKGGQSRTVYGIKISERASDTAAMVGSKSAGTRERDSLLKLFIGMAVEGYRYDPKSNRSSTAKKIASDLALVGLPIDEDTVRKYLAEGRELLLGDETGQDR
jgi:hypothetical protein